MSIDTSTDTRTIAELVAATGLPGHTDLSLLLLEGLTVRALNCMKRDGIHTLDQLAERSDDDLLDIRNFGVICLHNVRTVLSRQASRYAHILEAAPPWYQEIAYLAGALSNGYDQDVINRVLGELAEVAPGYLLCVWELRDGSVYCGDSDIFLDADEGGGRVTSAATCGRGCPSTPSRPALRAAPETRPCGRATALDDLPVDDTLHNYARHDS